MKLLIDYLCMYWWILPVIGCIVLGVLYWKRGLAMEILEYTLAIEERSADRLFKDKRELVGKLRSAEYDLNILCEQSKEKKDE